jgi:hypothetical protein
MPSQATEEVLSSIRTRGRLSKSAEQKPIFRVVRENPYFNLAKIGRK